MKNSRKILLIAGAIVAISCALIKTVYYPAEDLSVLLVVLYGIGLFMMGVGFKPSYLGLSDSPY